VLKPTPETFAMPSMKSVLITAVIAVAAVAVAKRLPVVSQYV
jgi:hypothetical protein